MYSVPVAMLVDIFFLLCWRFLLPRVPQDWALSKQVAFVVATTLAVWLLLAGVVALMLTHIFTSTSQLALAGSFALVGSVVTGLLACVTPPEAPTGQNKVPPKILVARGVCAGTAISIAIALSGISGVVGGIFAVFPAIFYTTMIGKHRFLSSGRLCALTTVVSPGLWLSQGDGVPLGRLLGDCIFRLRAVHQLFDQARLAPWYWVVRRCRCMRSCLAHCRPPLARGEGLCCVGASRRLQPLYPPSSMYAGAAESPHTGARKLCQTWMTSTLCYKTLIATMTRHSRRQSESSRRHGRAENDKLVNMSHVTHATVHCSYFIVASWR